MTAQYIAFHAAERPDAIAIVNDGRAIGFAEFSGTIRKFTRALRSFGLSRAAMAVIDCGDAYFNWVLRLAFEQLGVVTSTFQLPSTPMPMSFLRDFDIVLTDKTLLPGDARRQHAITPEWLRSIVDGPDAPEEPPPVKAPNDPIRIILTSGTTGTPKRLLNTRKTHEAWIARHGWIAEFTPRSRYLLALTLTVGAPTACIRAGGTVVIENRMPVGAAIAAHRITHTTLPPLALRYVLDELPTDYAKPSDLTILSYGASISRSLRERAMARLATRLIDIYGSSEGGYISSRSRASDTGTVWPDVSVEVVDEAGQPLPFGEIGQIRSRTDYMKDTYLDYPEVAGQLFKDGWFYSNDVGILHDPRRLQVLGRNDDLLNIGWRKFAPEVLEDLVQSAVEAGEVAVCSVPNSDGIEEACVVVSDVRGSDQEIIARINDALRNLRLGRLHVVRAIRLPRTANGKIQRRLLKETVIRSFQPLMPAGRS